ncbi:MAG: mechanosensitive ion channel family protein [Candidatus Saccharimonadales bacterium]
MIDEIKDIDWMLLGEVIAESTIMQVMITVIVALIVQVISGMIITATVGRILQHRRHIVVKTGPILSKEDVTKQEKTLRGVLRTMATVIIWIMAAIAILGQLHVNLATLATGAGLFGVIFGFGAQNVIKDFVAGLFVIGENQYRVGDVVSMTVAGVEVSGSVEDITIRITRLRDLDGNLHIVSNGSVQAVTNLSFQYANVNIDIQVPYTTDIDTLETVINEIGEEMSAHADWASNIYEPIAFLRIDDFTDAGIKIKALGKVVPAEQWAVAGEFRRRLKAAFDREGIAISYPHVIVQDEKPAVKSRASNKK